MRPPPAIRKVLDGAVAAARPDAALARLKMAATAINCDSNQLRPGAADFARRRGLQGKESSEQ